MGLNEASHNASPNEGWLVVYLIDPLGHLQLKTVLDIEPDQIANNFLFCIVLESLN